MTVTGCRRPLRACGAALAEDEARLSLGRSNGGFGRFARAWRILGIRGQRRFGFFFLFDFLCLRIFSFSHSLKKVFLRPCCWACATRAAITSPCANAETESRIPFFLLCNCCSSVFRFSVIQKVIFAVNRCGSS